MLQYKTEYVFVPAGPKETREMRALEAVSALESDGWMGHVEDALCARNRVSYSDEPCPGETFAVTFEREEPLA